MKRDWDMIKDILIEVESGILQEYEFAYQNRDECEHKKYHNIKILYDKGILSGIQAHDLNNWRIINIELTWDGHELLDKIRTNKIFEKIKEISINKGIELTFDSISKLYKLVLEQILG